MRRFLPAFTLLLLVACTPAVAPSPTSDASSSSATQSAAARVMAGKGIMIRLEKTTTEDAQAVPHTKATLHVSGVVTADIDLGGLGDIPGDLLYVNPESYPVYAEQENKPETIARFTSWFAGHGEQIDVMIHNQTLLVDRSFGDEQDEGKMACSGPDEIASVPLGQDVVVEWENVDSLKKTDKSSIAFCNKP